MSYEELGTCSRKVILETLDLISGQRKVLGVVAPPDLAELGHNFFLRRTLDRHFAKKFLLYNRFAL